MSIIKALFGLKAFLLIGNLVLSKKALFGLKAFLLIGNLVFGNLVLSKIEINISNIYVKF